MIQPALTADEWANGQVVFKKRSDYDSYGIELPSSPRRRVPWSGDKGSALVVFDGSWAAPIAEEHRMAAAALCLHGRISWEMVDALRWLVDSTAGKTGPLTMAELRDKAFLAISVADLLGSLLPPRTK